MERKHCARCNSHVAAKHQVCPNCHAPLPALTPIELDLNPTAFASYLNAQFQGGVRNPETRMARMLAIKSAALVQIQGGKVTDPLHVATANDFIREVNTQSDIYLSNVRNANRETGIRTMLQGVGVAAIGGFLTLVTFLAGSGGVFYVFWGAIAWGFFMIFRGLILRYSEPALPTPKW